MLGNSLPNAFYASRNAIHHGEISYPVKNHHQVITVNLVNFGGQWVAPYVLMCR